MISACAPWLECQVTGQKQNLPEDIFFPFYFQKCKLNEGYARGGERTESLRVRGGMEGVPNSGTGSREVLGSLAVLQGPDPRPCDSIFTMMQTQASIGH